MFNASRLGAPLTPSCTAGDASCTSQSHSSNYSYKQLNGKSTVVHNESFARNGTNKQGKPVVERKRVHLETKDGKTVNDQFQHYEIDQDTKGKFVIVKNPAGEAVHKEYVDSKLSTKDKAKHIAAVIKKHHQTLVPTLEQPSGQDSENYDIDSLVQEELDVPSKDVRTRTSRAPSQKRARSSSKSTSSSGRGSSRRRRTSSRSK